MRAILLGPHRVLGGRSSRCRTSVRRIGMLLVWAALLSVVLLAVVQTASPSDVAQAQDVTNPALNRAHVSGTLLSLYYDEPLDEDSTPAVTDFAVTADGSSIAVTGIFREREVLGLTLTSPVYEGQTVLVSYTPGTNRIQDLSRNEAAAFADEQVENDSAPRPGTTPPTPTDNTPPQLSEEPDGGIWVRGTQLTLVYNENLDENSIPDTTDYRVHFAGRRMTVDRVNVVTTTVTLTLAMPTYEVGQVLLWYTPGTNPVRDLSRNPAGALAWVEVVNASDPEPPPDNMMPPLLTSRSYVNTDLLRLVYNEPLAEGSVPANAYTIRIDGSLVAIEDGNEGVTVRRNVVAILLAQEASQGQTVTVSYTPPTEDPVQDLVGDQAAALDEVEVHNLLDGPVPPPPDTTPPSVRSGTAYEHTLKLRYNEDLDGESVPATTAYSVEYRGTDNPVEDVDIDGNVVTLTVTNSMNSFERALVSYVMPEDDPVQDTSGNRALALNGFALDVVEPPPDPSDNTPPERTGTVTYSPFHVHIWFNERLRSGSGGLPESAFTVTVDNEDVEVLAGIESKVIVLNLSVDVAIGQTVVVTYTQPSGTANRIKDISGNDAASFTVTTVRANRPPYFAEAHDPGRRSFTETVGDDVVTTAENIGDRARVFDHDPEHDPDVAGNLIYALAPPNDDPYSRDYEKFEIDLTGASHIRTKVGERYDREAKDSYAVRVVVADILTARSYYEYIITVLDAAEPPLAPTAPVVTAVPGSTTSLEVSWSAPSNAGRPAIESYDLQYGPGMDGPWTDGPQGVTGTSTSIGSLMPGPPYYVRVRATNADGDGDWSLPGSGTTYRPPNLVPAFAAESTARSFTETLGDAAVRTPSNIGAPVVATDLDGDPLTYSLEGADAARFALDSSSGQLRTQAGERYDREVRAVYAVRVKAEDGNGGEGATDVAITVDDATEAPVAPGVPLVEGGSGDRPNVYVTWTAPANAGRPAIMGYDVQYGPGMNGPWTDVPGDVAGDVAVIRGRTPRTRYYARVRATNADGDGAWSPPGSGMTNALSDGLAPPANLQPAIGDRRVTVTWDAPPVITGYQYRVSNDDGASWNPDWTNIPGSSARTTSFTAWNLANNFEHVIEVRALGGVKPSGASRVTAAPMGPPSVPLMPETLQITSRDRALYVSWYKPEEDPRAPVTSYEARYRPYGSSGAWVNLPVTSAHDTPRTHYYHFIGGLDNRRPYEVEVVPFNSVGRGPRATASGVPQAEYRNGPPSGGGDGELDLGPLTAQWTDRLNSGTLHPDTMFPQANVIGNSCLAPATFQVFWGVQSKRAEEYETDIQTRYGAGEVTHRVGAETVSGSGRTTAGEQVYIYGTANLHRYSVLAVRVRARFDPEGWSTWSQPVNLHCFEADSPATSEQQAQPGNSPAATALAAVPGAPRSLRVQTAGTGELAATWQAPESNGGAGVTGYRVQWRLATGSWHTVADVSSATTTGTSYTITSLSLDTGYAVRVIATNRVGDGPPSAERTETALPQASLQQGGASNIAATGQPTISGTAQVGGTLTAVTSGIADGNGLDNASFSYQWLRNDGSSDTGISGATGSSYTVHNDDGGQNLRVRVSFTDDDGFGESLTSGAAAVPAPTPLTASFDAGTVPGSHDGSTAFTLEFLFNKEPSLEEAAVRDHVLTVTGGEVAGARQTTQGSDLRWEITVRPDGQGDVTATLPRTTGCGDQGAVCTRYGQMLSQDVSTTVNGPEPEEEEEEQGPTEPPPAPTNLTGTINEDGSITITWTAPEDDSVTGYQVLRRRPQWGETELEVYVDDTGGRETSYRDTNTVEHIRYVYRVKARNSAGLSEWSNFVRLEKE